MPDGTADRARYFGRLAAAVMLQPQGASAASGTAKHWAWCSTAGEGWWPFVLVQQPVSGLPSFGTVPGGGSSPYGAVVSAAALLCEPLAFRRNTHSSCKERECSVWRFALISVVVLVVAFPTAAAGQAAAPAGRDIAEAAGLGTARVNTHGETSVRDLDGDGDRDIVLSNHGSAPSELLELVNGGGGERFQLVEDIPFGKRDRHSCAWGNVNSDGRPDLYCSEGGQGSTATDKSNELWVQQPDGSFVDRGEQLGVADPRGRGRDVTFLDVENDGDADLFVGNLPRTDTVVAPNQLYINDGGSFRSAPEYGVNRNLGGQLRHDRGLRQGRVHRPVHLRRGGGEGEAVAPVPQRGRQGVP